MFRTNKYLKYVFVSLSKLFLESCSLSFQLMLILGVSFSRWYMTKFSTQEIRRLILKLGDKLRVSFKSAIFFFFLLTIFIVPCTEFVSRWFRNRNFRESIRVLYWAAESLIMILYRATSFNYIQVGRKYGFCK